MTFHVTVLTLFPEMFPGPLGYSLIGKALENGIWSLDTINIRDFGIGKHQAVDDTPYGGGAGMVMRADVVAAAIEEGFKRYPNAKLVHFTPAGQHLTQKLAATLLAPLPEERVGVRGNDVSLMLLCGRYEGIDERVIDKYQLLEISLGDFVMTGGEIAAMALLDACVRLLPGVVGEQESLSQESFGLSPDYACLLEHPHYTKPPVWEGLAVPETLLSGHHEKIERWRKEQAEKITQARRPDLWAKHIEGSEQ